MGLFDFFSKSKKETLDQGLEKTKQSFFSKIARVLVGKSHVDEEVLDDLEEMLITSDVGVETTLKIIDRIQARVSKDKVMGTEELNQVLREEIIALLEENNSNQKIPQAQNNWVGKQMRVLQNQLVKKRVMAIYATKQ